jgi:hypothetical protein
VFEVQFDEKRIEEMMLLEIEKKIKQLESRYVFWDLDELQNQTCMSLGNIKDKFFFDPRFPKHKIGGKWYMPAKETEEFLLQWIKEQPRH